MIKDEYLELIKDPDFENLKRIMKPYEVSLWSIINKLQRDENSYSDFLAYFLNPRESHGLDDRFLKKFLYNIISNENEMVGESKIELHPIDIELFDFNKTNVYREYNLDEYGRIDILLEDTENGYLIFLENKLYSKEGKNQTNRYYKAQKEKFDITLYPESKRILIFLSPDGLTAENEQFINISYQTLIDVITDLLKEIEISNVIERILIDYVSNLKEIILDSDKIKLAEQLYSRYADIIDFIYSVGNENYEKTDENWNGEDFYYNIGENNHRNWDDYLKHSFFAAGGGKKYSDPLKRLKIGNRIFAYFKGKGYLGVGTVIEEAIPINDFISELEKQKIKIQDFTEPGISYNSDDLEYCNWIVKVKWKKFKKNRNDAIFFKGIFANQNVVCRLTNKHSKTIEKVKEEFGIVE